VAASSGTRSLEGGGHAQPVARTPKRGGVILPSGLVEVDGEEEARLVEQQRVHTRYEGLSLGITSRQVPTDDVVCDRQEAAVGAFRTLDSRLLTDALHPLIRTRGGIPGSPGLATLEPTWIDIRSTAKQRTKQGNLLVRR
jgi:hypothetical protein